MTVKDGDLGWLEAMKARVVDGEMEFVEPGLLWCVDKEQVIDTLSRRKRRALKHEKCPSRHQILFYFVPKQ